MRGGLLMTLAATFGGLSLAAVGGASAIVPAVRHVAVVDRAWMTDAVFGQLYAISQAAPGPNVLIAGAMGWKVAGLAGLLVASLAVIGPSSVLVLGLGRFVDHHGERWWMRAVRRALGPVAIGLLAASALTIARTQNHLPWEWGLTGGAALLALRRVHPLAVLAIAAVAGAVLA